METTRYRDSGLWIIAHERLRQVLDEGWTPEHDDRHTNGELAWAAMCYAAPDRGGPEMIRELVWPWDDKWWKPTPNNRILELAKAGALIAAEIDRLLRLQGKQDDVQLEDL